MEGETRCEGASGDGRPEGFSRMFPGSRVVGAGN